MITGPLSFWLRLDVTLATPQTSRHAAIPGPYNLSAPPGFSIPLFLPSTFIPLAQPRSSQLHIGPQVLWFILTHRSSGVNLVLQPFSSTLVSSLRDSASVSQAFPWLHRLRLHRGFPSLRLCQDFPPRKFCCGLGVPPLGGPSPLSHPLISITTFSLHFGVVFVLRRQQAPRGRGCTRLYLQELYWNVACCVVSGFSVFSPFPDLFL